jgi:hypothetical protein
VGYAVEDADPAWLLDDVDRTRAAVRPRVNRIRRSPSKQVRRRRQQSSAGSRVRSNAEPTCPMQGTGPRLMTRESGGGCGCRATLEEGRGERWDGGAAPGQRHRSKRPCSWALCHDLLVAPPYRIGEVRHDHGHRVRLLTANEIRAWSRCKPAPTRRPTPDWPPSTLRSTANQIAPWRHVTVQGTC